jgi:predicted ATP-grasp superfamily ATP-dependent carboligase
MGNSDLVFIINGLGFMVKGSEYYNYDDATQKAIQKFKDFKNRIKQMVYEANETDLLEKKEKMLQDIDFESIISKIEIYKLN